MVRVWIGAVVGQIRCGEGSGQIRGGSLSLIRINERASRKDGDGQSDPAARFCGQGVRSEQQVCVADPVVGRVDCQTWSGGYGQTAQRSSGEGSIKIVHHLNAFERNRTEVGHSEIERDCVASVAQVDNRGERLGDPNVRVGIVDWHVDFGGNHIVGTRRKTDVVVESGCVRDLLHFGRQWAVDEHAVVERGHG